MYIMGDVLRILDRFRITGRGVVYTVKISKGCIIHIGDVLLDLRGNRFEVSGIEMFRGIIAEGKSFEDMPLGLMFKQLDGVEAYGNILVKDLNDINFIFCNHPLYQRKVDEDYEVEYQEAGLHHSCALFSYEDMERGKLSLFGEEISGLTIYRGWMMKPEMYSDFYTLLEQKGIYLINTPEEYERYHTLPGWYDDFADETAQSVFLTGSGKFSKSETHMELIFRIMAKDIVKDRIRNNPEFYVENEEELNKDTYTFIIFSRELEYLENEKTDKPLPYSELLESFWGKIERYYNMFIDWYENREWYHLIGVLLAKEENQTESYFEELCDLYRTHTKSEFVCKLKERIINEIDFEDKDKTDFSFTHEVVEEYLKSLSYSDKKIDKDKIRNILLLFNVISMQNNTDSDPRFPFDSYQKQKWDIEHIHSVTTERAQNKKEREEWLDSAWPYIESVASDPKVFEMYTKAKDVRDNKFYDDEHATEYDEMYNSVIAFFSGETGIDNKPINEISNLTLLDQRTNRGYRNHIFPVKRNKILEKSGVESFIPLCTKNVFLKFYSKTVSQMYLWDKNDRKDYFDKMADEIFYYLSGTRKEQ